MTAISAEQQKTNKEKSLDLAKALFPNKEWLLTEPNIWTYNELQSISGSDPKKST